MMTSRTSHPFGVLTALAFTLAAGVAHAGSTTCNGPLPPGTYGNIVVPAGAVCNLLNSVVNGNIAIQTGANVGILLTTIIGNVSATDPAAAQLTNSEVHGNVSIVGATGQEAGIASMVCGTIVTGNVLIADSSSDVIFGSCAFGPGNMVSGNVSIEDNEVDTLFDVRSNIVGMNMTIDDNTGPATKTVEDNSVTGNLNCSDNTLLLVSGNTAKKLNGQCKP